MRNSRVCLRRPKVRVFCYPRGTEVHIVRRMFPIVLVALAVLVGSAAAQNRPNILVIWGDDIGQSNISAYTMGMMGYRTPNIDRVAKEGMIF